MNKNKILLSCVFALSLSLSACAEKVENSINVFRADQLMNAGEISNRYVGMVVSENTIKVQKDYTKSIDEILVEEGQKVSKGDTLFTYNTSDLESQLARKQIELDGSYHMQSKYEEDLAFQKGELEKVTDEATKSQIEIEIKNIENQILQLSYTIRSQEQEYNRISDDMNNVKVKAPSNGTIKKIDESGQSGAFITIQQDGAYKVKAVINEMNMASGIQEGVRVKVISRTDANKVWFGEVKTLDLQGNSQNNEMMGGFNDPMNQSTTYSFFVELDNTDDLLLGQHVYVELVLGEEKTGLWIPNYFVFNEVNDETLNKQKAEVWVANSNDKIEKRNVVLGMRDDINGTIEILEGLSNDEYIADPKNDVNSGMKVEYHNASDFELNVDNAIDNNDIEPNAVENPLEVEVAQGE